MNYSIIEKQAIVKILWEMMIVDGHRDQREERYLNDVKNLLGLSDLHIDPTIDRAKSFCIISKMTDDQKMEIASMLQQMIMADGIQDKDEMYLFGEIVSYTGIDKAVERKTAGMNIQYDDAQIYLNASKLSLSRRSREYLNVINEQAREFMRMFSNQNYTLDDKCNLILEYTKQSVVSSGWNLDDVDGVTWFIGNYTDAMIKANVIYDYDTVFVKCFKEYFKQINYE